MLQFDKFRRIIHLIYAMFRGEIKVKRILVVVDFQNDFVTGALGFERAVKAESCLVALIREARESGADVLFTLDTHGADYMDTEEGRHLPAPHCIKGTDGWRLTPAVAAEAREGECIEKPTFPSLELAGRLRAGCYDEVTLAGVVTNICVISNAVIAKAALPNAKISVVRAACASNDPRLEEEAYDILKNLHVDVI